MLAHHLSHSVDRGEIMENKLLLDLFGQQPMLSRGIIGILRMLRQLLIQCFQETDEVIGEVGHLLHRLKKLAQQMSPR